MDVLFALGWDVRKMCARSIGSASGQRYALTLFFRVSGLLTDLPSILSIWTSMIDPTNAPQKDAKSYLGSHTRVDCYGISERYITFTVAPENNSIVLTRTVRDSQERDFHVRRI